MHKGLMVGLIVCMSVTLQINGGLWTKLKLWRQRKKTEALERNVVRASQKKMNKKELGRCYKKSEKMMYTLGPRVFMLHGDSQQEWLRKRCSHCRSSFGELLDKEIEEDF